LKALALPRLRHTLLALRILVGVTMAAHGLMRLYQTFFGTSGVPAFGGFLASRGLPLGPETAWLLTIVEVFGGLALALGVAVPYLCLWFAVQLSVGIALVHARLGWFTVGAQIGGMEYSVLLILCMLVVASDALEPQRGDATSTSPGSP
jgi:putative oxidoreductase